MFIVNYGRVPVPCGYTDVCVCVCLEPCGGGSEGHYLLMDVAGLGQDDLSCSDNYPIL